MAISTLQRRIYFNGAICGAVLALLITLFDLLGWLNPLEAWLYDLRAATCQQFTPAPSPDIVYLDIDDEALDTIQRWPWDRSRMAAVLDELRLANPKVVALDIIFSETQANRIERTPEGEYRTVDEDPALADAIGKLGNVVLGSSFQFQPTGDAATRLRRDAVRALSKDITLDRAAFLDSLHLSPSQVEMRSQLEEDFIGVRREAIRQAIRDAFDAHVDRLEEIERRLIPALGAPGAPIPPQFRTHVDIIAQEYAHVRSERLIGIGTIDAPKDIATLPPDATYNSIPVPILCERMAASGYTEHQLFKDPVVRSIPLFVRVEDRFYPQMALVTACRLLDADLGKARFTDQSVTIPSAKGDIRIPVRAVYSDTMRRHVGFVFDIPWYGTRDWEMMNDWPAHKSSAQHYPIDGVWSVVEVERRLNANDAVLDECTKYFQELDPSFKHPELGRTAAIERLRNDLKELGYGQLLKSDPSKLSDEEKLVAKFTYALNTAYEQNVSLAADLKRARSVLAERFAGKAVLIGATATSTGDFVPTSLHARCPGVVVHGVIMNAIVNRDFLTTSPRWVNIAGTLLAGLLATLITCLLPPARGVLLLLLVGFLYFVTNGMLFYDRMNWVVDAGAPLVAMFVCWGGVMVARTIVETLERLRLKREAVLIEHEIELARQVQSALIPKELKVLDTVDSHGWTKAATTTGGDCFDLWRLKDGRMGILVADASGHGLGPSIVVSQVRALIRSMCDLYAQPQELLNVVNTRMAEDLGGRKFCTCFLGFLSADGKLNWGSAGHGPMLWAPTADGPIAELNGTCLPLGVSEDNFADESIPLIEIQSGGWLAVVSDGIFEAADPKGDPFGVERINASIRSSQRHASDGIVDALRRSVDAWQVKPDPDDDQTIVFLRLQTDGTPSALEAPAESSQLTGTGVAPEAISQENGKNL